MNRFKEPSTYASIAAIIAALAPLLHFNIEITGAIGAIIGSVGIIVRESGKNG